MKWTHSILTVVLSISVAFAPQLQHLVGAHPEVAVIIGGLYTILGHLLPSPIGKV